MPWTPFVLNNKLNALCEHKPKLGPWDWRGLNGAALGQMNVILFHCSNVPSNYQLYQMCLNEMKLNVQMNQTTDALRKAAHSPSGLACSHTSNRCWPSGKQQTINSCALAEAMTMLIWKHFNAYMRALQFATDKDVWAVVLEPKWLRSTTHI